MDSADESDTRVTSNEVRSLHSLLKVTEELLFSFPLASDLVKKYEILRESAFTKAGLIHSASKLRKLQKEAHAKQRVSVTFKEMQTDPIIESPLPEPPEVSSYRFSELESRANVIRYELISRLESTHDVVRQYQQLLNFILSSVTNELNRFGELIEVQGIVKYPPIRITEVDKGVDITPEKEITVEELEIEQEKLMRWFEKLDQEHISLLEEFKDDFTNRNSKFALLLQHVAEKYAEQNDCISGLENELKMTQEQTYSQVEELKEKVATLTQELMENRTAKNKEIESYKTEVTKQTEKQLLETKRNFESQLDRLLADRERSVKTMTEAEKAVLATRLDSLKEVEALKQQLAQELSETKQTLEAQLDKERKVHRKEIAEKEDELSLKEREWKTMKRRLEEALSKAKEPPVEVVTVNTESRSTQTINETAHKSIQGNLSDLFQEIDLRLKPLYQKHGTTDKAWNQMAEGRRQALNSQFFALSEYIELLLEAEFAAFFGLKLASDNAWLIDRLTDFGKENEKLRLAASAPPQTTTVYLSPAKPVGKLHKQVWDDIKSTATALREFEEARFTLLRKLDQPPPLH